jgi:putative holliday junction resolvase
LPLLALAEFAAALPVSGALLALDPGSKRIGIAASDSLRRIASPVQTLARTKFAADSQEIWRVYDARACAGMVIGLPLNMDGSAGPSAQAARAFARNLAAQQDAPILLWDERLSTAAVTRTLIEADSSRKRREEVVDKLAAAYLLQGVLDRLANLDQGGPG